MPMAHDQAVVSNRLLRALPPSDRGRVATHLKRVTWTRGQALLEYDEPVSTLFFPLSAVASIVQPVGDDHLTEVVTVGTDGVVGLSAFLAATPSAWRVFCQIPGDALTLPAEVLGNIASASSGVRDVLGRYCQALLLQMARNFSCNQAHSMPQRCSRWILLVRSQVGRDAFPLTQQALATMLGVRRATVTVTAGTLQELGLIRYRHGFLRVIDPPGLEDAACECYRSIRRDYSMLFPAE